MPVINLNGLIDNRIEAIKKYHESCGIKKAELDLSGGIDSAVMAVLLVKALNSENVLLVHTRIYTSSDQTGRAIRVAEALKAPFVNIDLSQIYDQLSNSMQKLLEEAVKKSVSGDEAYEIASRIALDDTIPGSIRSTLRAPVGRGFNRMFGGGIRHGTGNECEDRFLRYYQKGGDGEVDTNPIEMLSKTEVFQLAWGLGERFPEVKEIMRELISVQPSADLWGGRNQTDEGELKKLTGVELTYGRVNPETGEVVSIGTIERVARLVDNMLPDYNLPVLANYYLEGHKSVFSSWVHDFFPETKFSYKQAVKIIQAVVKMERITRHKANDNIPMLGTRRALLEQEILANDFGGK